MLLRQQNKMSDGTSKDEDTMEGQRHQEQVEISIVSLAHTVADPRTMMIKPEERKNLNINQ